MSPDVVIRADASVALGTGHIMRCLTLAAILRRRGAEIRFVCRELDGHLCDMIDAQGYVVARLPKLDSAPPPGDGSWREDAEQTRGAIAALDINPQLLVVDHYALDARWERSMRSMARALFVMDDLANRRHDCDLLLDQGLRDASHYAGLVQPSTRLFVGPQYALLRPEFDRVSARLRDQGLRRLLVFFGGTDPDNETLKVAAALRAMGSSAPLTKIVLGPTNPHAASVREAVHGLEAVTLIGTTDRMAALMDEADLGIGACGGAAWERCALGLPSLVAILADNQREDTRVLHAMGAVRSLGEASAINVGQWVQEIRRLQNDPKALATMSRSAARVMPDRKKAALTLESALIECLSPRSGPAGCREGQEE